MIFWWSLFRINQNRYTLCGINFGTSVLCFGSFISHDKSMGLVYLPTFYPMMQIPWDWLYLPYTFTIEDLEKINHCHGLSCT